MPDSFAFSATLPKLLYDDLRSFLLSSDIRPIFHDQFIYAASIICHSLSDSFKSSTLKKAFNLTNFVPIYEWHCNLYSCFLHANLGQRYNDIIKVLVNAGFIKRGNRYIKSTGTTPGQCKAFWLGAKYARYYYDYNKSKFLFKNHRASHISGRIVVHDIKSKTLLKRIYNVRVSQKASQVAIPGIADYYEHLKHFHIDSDRAVYELTELKREGLMSSNVADEMKKVNRFNSMYTDPIALYVKRDPYGRVHTNMTSMKSEIRDRCLSCDGMPTAGVDIKSSQASFLSAIIDEWIKVSDTKYYEPSSTFVDISRFWRRERDDEFRRCLRTEAEGYRKLLSDGRLYEYFADCMSSSSRKYTRKEAKKAFLATLFADRHIDITRNPDRYAIRQVWLKEFPHIIACIDHMKWHNHAALAHEMQRTESSFIFERVIPRITQEIGCHYCTIHDSVIVPVPYIADAKRIMDDELSACRIPTLTEIEGVFNAPTEEMVANEKKTLDEMATISPREQYGIGEFDAIGPEDLPEY